MSEPIGPVDEQYVPTCGNGPVPINVAEFERYAHKKLDRNIFGYYAAGSNDMLTLRENRKAYSRLRLLPRVLRDVSCINYTTTVLGEPVASPICVAPSAMQRMVHHHGEVATATAAAKANTLMTLSSLSTTSMENVSAASKSVGGGPLWFQLYILKDKNITLDLIQRAEAAGYKALVITVDTPVLGRREPDIVNQFSLPPHLTLGNFEHLGGSHSHGVSTMESEGSKLTSYFSSLIDPSISWAELSWVRDNTSLPIVLKGVITEADALCCVQHKVDAIWVSNHGARQLDTTPATIEALPGICAAVKGSEVEVYVDGGITRGTDVFKALALGANAVFIGRPVLWGLAHSGEEGVTKVLELLNDELKMAMQLAGCTSLNEITNAYVRHANSFRLLPCCPPSKL